MANTNGMCGPTVTIQTPSKYYCVSKHRRRPKTDHSSFDPHSITMKQKRGVIIRGFSEGELSSQVQNPT